MWTIGIVGLGVLGNAIYETLSTKTLCNNSSLCTTNVTVDIYDKYKNIGSLDAVKSSKLLFLCLPTPYSSILSKFDIAEIEVTCEELVTMEYTGIIIIKSTLEPGTCELLNSKYKTLQIIHNPEFLTSKTAALDFANQKHIILGLTSQTRVDSILAVVKFYKEIFNAILKDDIKQDSVHNNRPDLNTISDHGEKGEKAEKAIISICSSLESETIKLACNTFYATKIQFFTEIKLMCDKIGIEYNNVLDKMLMNKWINPMHTEVPGHDGQISFGGACFPKDIKGLNSFMAKLGTQHGVIESVVEENNEMRTEFSNEN